MLQFQLFRIHVYPSEQGKLFDVRRTPSEILRDTIRSLPDAEFKKGAMWHIGNVESVDEGGIYFRIGRTSRSKVAVFEDGSFADAEFEASPYTHVLLDVPLEVCAIAGKARLSTKTSAIASRLVSVLNRSASAREHETRFEIKEIPDPNEFISYLNKAVSISKFWIAFRRPNAWDVNGHFVRPMQELLSESKGERGKAEIAGEGLDAGSLEDLARSAASTGDDAGAWLRNASNGEKMTKRLKGNPVVIPHEDLADAEQKKGLLTRIREVYRGIRGASGPDQ
ncbi:MAG: hypothetical protein J7M19_04615 [Planctomycetes bacterium]|nr:hypothetical protein [Planctomycetota bacterium]